MSIHLSRFFSYNWLSCGLEELPRPIVHFYLPKSLILQLNCDCDRLESLWYSSQSTVNHPTQKHAFREPQITRIVPIVSTLKLAAKRMISMLWNPHVFLWFSFMKRNVSLTIRKLFMTITLPIICHLAWRDEGVWVESFCNYRNLLKKS